MQSIWIPAMLDHPVASPSPIGRRLLALACPIVLGLGASPAGALPPVQTAFASGIRLIEGGTAGSAPAPAQEQQAPLADLNELLEATRTKLEELTKAAGTVTTSTKLREKVQALEADNQRLAGELAQTSTRQAELQGASEVAGARIAELTEAVEAARRESVRLDEALAGLRRQNTQLSQSVDRAHTAREAAVAKAERTHAEMTKKLEAATDAAARSKAELAAAQEQLGQAAGAAVEAERARQAARSEADALQGDAARARQEVIAAKAEIDRLRTANGELEQQIASLHMELRSATETARQNLVVMAEKIAALHAVLEPERADKAAPPVSPQAEPDPVANEPATAGPAPAPTRQPAAPEPASSIDASRPADAATSVAMVATSPAPAAVDVGLARFHADLKALNDLELSAAGANLFSGIESTSGHTVHVGTTAAWNSLPPVGQRSYLDSLLDYWVAARGGEGRAVVRIVDQSGRVLVEKSTP